MSAWDELLAATHPGREVDSGTYRWLVLRRSCRFGQPGSDNQMTLTVEFVRAGSPADPRTIAAEEGPR